MTWVSGRWSDDHVGTVLITHPCYQVSQPEKVDRSESTYKNLKGIKLLNMKTLALFTVQMILFGGGGQDSATLPHRSCEGRHLLSSGQPIQ